MTFISLQYCLLNAFTVPVLKIKDNPAFYLNFKVFSENAQQQTIQFLKSTLGKAFFIQDQVDH